MTRYDDMDQSGGGISVSGRAPGAPRAAALDSRGDPDWQLALYGKNTDQTTAYGPETRLSLLSTISGLEQWPHVKHHRMLSDLVRFESTQWG